MSGAIAFLDTNAGSAPMPRAGAWRMIRRLRLATGVVLFTYVATHLLNHALGLVSVPAMEAGLVAQKFVWQGVLGTAALYAALATHLLLGLWALYERRHFGWTRHEILQVLLGLAIPVLLANHLAVTRLALALYGLEKGYAQELYALWVTPGLWGLVQVGVLIAAWTHGIIGLYASARLRAWFPRAAPILLTLAVLVPVLALLGFEEGGRTVERLSATEAWRAEALSLPHAGTPAQKAALADARTIFWDSYAAAIALVLAARLVRRVRERHAGQVAITYPSGAVVRIPRGMTVLEASRIGRVPHASVCGGRGRCTTCRIRVVGPAAAIPPADLGERAVLERVRSDPETVRLACQLRPTGAIGVIPLVPPPLARPFAASWGGSAIGEERFVVALFADMRGSTLFARKHMPYDGVFLLGRFITTLAECVTEAGGAANQFTGDGIFALFGLGARNEAAHAAACRAALDASAGIARAVARFNQAFATSLAGPVDYGIGLHAGLAIVGEIGLGRNVTVTAIGDVVNIASRLQAATRTMDCHALVSAETARLAGATFGPARPVPIRDEGEIEAIPLTDAHLRAWPASGGQGASCDCTPSA